MSGLDKIWDDVDGLEHGACGSCRHYVSMDEYRDMGEDEIPDDYGETGGVSRHPSSFDGVCLDRYPGVIYGVHEDRNMNCDDYRPLYREKHPYPEKMVKSDKLDKMEEKDKKDKKDKKEDGGQNG